MNSFIGQIYSFLLRPLEVKVRLNRTPANRPIDRQTHKKDILKSIDRQTGSNNRKALTDRQFWQSEI